MPDLKSTLTEMQTALTATIAKIDALTQSEEDLKVRTAIENELPFFTCVQARNAALQNAITAKVKRNRAGWSCAGTVAVLHHVADQFGDPQAQTLMNTDQRLAASKLSTRANKLALDAETFAASLPKD